MKYICKYCDKLFNNPQRLGGHITANHNKNRKIYIEKIKKNKLCKYCGKSNKNKYSLYCSDICRKINIKEQRKNMIGKLKRKKLNICLNCNKKTSNTKFCSRICSSSYKRRENEKEYIIDGMFICEHRTIKRYLIKECGNTCSICNNTKWMGKDIPLVMDHVNGDPYDNSIDNLRLVCGNCDMQLPTYKSKNKGNGRKERRIRERKNLKIIKEISIMGN